MKNIIKKITAIAMCGVLTVGSVLMTGAVSEDESHKDFEVTGTTQKISNNQLFVTTTGYTENTAKNFGAMFISTDYQKYSVMFKDCIDAPKFVNLPKNQEFTRHMITANNRYFGNTGMKFNYDSTGGEYVKMRIKLSDYFPDVFNDSRWHLVSCSSGNSHTPCRGVARRIKNLGYLFVFNIINVSLSA